MIVDSKFNKWLLPFFPKDIKFRKKWWHKSVVNLSMILSVFFNFFAVIVFFETFSFNIGLAAVKGLFFSLFGFFGSNLLYRVFLIVMETDLENLGKINEKK